VRWNKSEEIRIRVLNQQPAGIKEERKMKTATINTYDFNELSDSAKQSAMFNLNDGYSWTEEAVDSIKGFCAHFDLTLTDYCVGNSSNRSNNVRVRSNNVNTEELSDVRLFKYLSNKFDIKNTLSGNCPFTGYCADEYCLDELRDFMAKPDDRNYEELMQDCAEKWLNCAVAKCDYQDSEEYFTEMADCNGWMFLEDGRMYY
jgi:hypothetical protein